LTSPRSLPTSLYCLPLFPVSSEREVTSPPNLKVLGALDNYSLVFVIFINFFGQLKDCVGQVLFLVSCPKGQVEKYVNVEACTLMHNKYIITYECHDNAPRMWKVVQLEKYFDFYLYSHHFSLLSLTSLLSAPEREVTSPSDFKVVGALVNIRFISILLYTCYILLSFS
jgi:hypothetical protein